MWKILDVISELFFDEISLAVATTEKYVYYRPSKRINLKIKPGDPVKKGTIAYKALQTKQIVSEFIERDVFGIPYYGTAVPYFDGDKLKGVIIAVRPALTEGKSVITIKSEDGWIPIPFSDVKFLRVKNQKTYVYGKRHIGTHKNSLLDFEHILPKEKFIRCHRSYIVNIHYIKEIYPDTHSTFILMMDGGEMIPVSQSYSSYFRKMLGF